MARKKLPLCTMCGREEYAPPGPAGPSRCRGTDHALCQTITTAKTARAEGLSPVGQWSNVLYRSGVAKSLRTVYRAKLRDANGILALSAWWAPNWAVAIAELGALTEQSKPCKQSKPCTRKCWHGGSIKRCMGQGKCMKVISVKPFLSAERRIDLIHAITDASTHTERRLAVEQAAQYAQTADKMKRISEALKHPFWIDEFEEKKP